MKAFGAPLKRKEDPRLLRGEGRYVADLKLHGMTHAAVLRSDFAHARVRGIRLDELRADPRVLDVLTGADVARLPHILCIDAEETTGCATWASRWRSSSSTATATTRRTCCA
jgi:CO/xanthine dehydrogenase Mo-binding subunit